MLGFIPIVDYLREISAQKLPTNYFLFKRWIILFTWGGKIPKNFFGRAPAAKSWEIHLFMPSPEPSWVMREAVSLGGALPHPGWSGWVGPPGWAAGWKMGFWCSPSKQRFALGKNTWKLEDCGLKLKHKFRRKAEKIILEYLDRTNLAAFLHFASAQVQYFTSVFTYLCALCLFFFPFSSDALDPSSCLIMFDTSTSRNLANWNDHLSAWRLDKLFLKVELAERQNVRCFIHRSNGCSSAPHAVQFISTKRGGFALKTYCFPRIKTHSQ